jgi:3-oxoacyl-[acyl-carrier-protein] synthase-3
MSSIVDYADRSTCILFGDGAGAVLLEPNTEGYGIKDSILRSDGSGRVYLHQKSGGSVSPPSHKTVDNKEHFVFQDGQPVFKFAVKGMADVSAEIMERNGLTADDVAWLVPHQANKANHRRHCKTYGSWRRKDHDEHPEVRQHHQRYRSHFAYGIMKSS